MNFVTRRSFVVGAVSTSTCMALAQSGGPAEDFPTGRDRIAVASYPFRAMISAPNNHDFKAGKGVDLVGFGRYVSATFQVRRIEPLDSHFPSTELPQVRRMKAALDAAGVAVANVPVDEHVELCSADAAIRAQGNARYARWIDIAKILGSPSVRISLPKCGDASDVARAVDALRPTLRYAQSQKIVVNLENDDPVLASDARILQAIKLAQTPWLRALPDFANSLMGGDEAFNQRAVKGMFAHAFNMAHVKDAEVIQGQRRTVSLSELFRVAKQANYRGYYSMESDSNADPVKDTRHLIEETLRLM